MRISSRLIYFIFLLIIVFAGCAPDSRPSEIENALPQQSTETEPQAGPIRVVLTDTPGQNTRASKPLTTRSENPTSPPSSLTESTPTPSGSPPEQDESSQPGLSSAAPIQIFNPNPGSRVTSPIQVVAQLNLTDANLIRIELRGEDGRLLSRVLKSTGEFPWSSATLSIPLLFEIRADEQPARLFISADDLYGRVLALTSTGITLLKDGDQVLLEAQNGPEPITILKPGAGEIISGGSLTVSGALQPEVPFPLQVELISSAGRRLGYKWVEDSGNQERGPRSYSVEVPYSTAARTPARLLVFTTGANGDQILYLNSIKIILNP